MAKKTQTTSKGKSAATKSSGTSKSSGAMTSGRQATSGAKTSTGRSSSARSGSTNRTTGAAGTKASISKSSAASARAKSSPKELGDLFLETLKDMYNAEKQILRALPKMAKAAGSDELRKAFETHTQETQGQVGRLERVFEILGKRASSKTCHAIQGLVEEGQEVMKEFKGSAALDAGLLAAAQAVEHYEISRYGTMRTWASQLGMQDAARLLDETLAEEKKTDQLLTRIAEAAVNRKAA